jgi:acetyltransferase-like isoleucine patch superfamily enzyme
MSSIVQQLERINVLVAGMQMAAAPIYVEAPVEVGGLVYSCKVGRFSSLGCRMIGSRGSLTTIGRYCLAAANSQIGVGSHPTDWLSIHFFQYRDSFVPYPSNHPTQLKDKFEESVPTTLGNDIWIGANAFIKSGVTIGHGAIIGAGAVVVKDVPPYAIVGGVPAKIIRYRFSEDIVERLLNVRWWEFDHDVISRLPFNDIGKCLDMLEELVAKGSVTRSQPSYIQLA